MDHQRYIRPAMFGIAGLGVLAVLGVPVLALLPFLVFLACPLMMVLMMMGMGHGHSHGGHGDRESGQQGEETDARPPLQDRQ